MLLKIGNDTIYFRHRETNLLVSSRWKTSCAWENPGSSFQMAQRWVNWWRYPNKCMPSNITNLSSFIVRVFHVRLEYTLENMDWQAWDLWDTCTLRNSKIGIQNRISKHGANHPTHPDICHQNVVLAAQSPSFTLAPNSIWLAMGCTQVGGASHFSTTELRLAEGCQGGCRCFSQVHSARILSVNLAM